MPIEFKSERKTVEALTADGSPMRHEIEYRWDPLTFRVSTICPHLKEKWTEFYSIREEEWLTEMVEVSKENCPFCRPTIDTVAAKFPPQQLENERLTINGVTVFPNLYPRTDFEAVITSPDVHYLNLNEFNPDLLGNFLTVARECINQAYQRNNKLLYPVIGCNYLSSAGASLVHYHMQLSMQEYPFESVRGFIDASTHYEATEHANFWVDLMERNTEREITRKDNLYWYTPFAPTGFCEVRAIITKPTFLAFTTEDVRDLAEGLSAILRYYNDHGFAAFNFIIYSGRLNSGNEGFLSGIQIIARPNPRSNYLSIDSWYMPLLLSQTIVLERPEELARDLRTYF
jgi:UDPglucose--hexose-1-phosphate uridylyltransferase